VKLPGLLFLVVSAALALAAAGRAEMPANREPPLITGPAVAGEVLLGHNGTWLYADGSRCGFECTYSFRWERCSMRLCRTVSNQRGYRPRLSDLHQELRVEVTATKYDCGEWNYAAGTQECRFDARSAYSDPVSIDGRGRVSAARLAWPARLRIERALVGRGVVRVTVADTLGRLVQRASVSVGERMRRTNADGAVLLAVSSRVAWVTARAGMQTARVRLSRP
jgi:hypothetical protein